MAEPMGLAAHAPLHGFHCTGDGIEVSEHPPRSLVSIALRADAAAARETVERALGVGLPDIGTVASCEFAGGASVLGLQPDQWFVSMPETASPERVVRDAIDDAPGDRSGTAPGNAASDAIDGGSALTDQSDAWASLVVEGPRATLALERVCRLDLHITAFAPGRVARTAMEHLSVIVVRESSDRFVLLSPRSSAASFAHAIETSMRNVS